MASQKGEKPSGVWLCIVGISCSLSKTIPHYADFRLNDGTEMSLSEDAMLAFSPR